MRVRGASKAAGMVQGDGDGMCVCMARERRACRCATRATGRARGLEAPRERRCAPPRQQGGGSRRRLVAAPSLVATPKPLRTCRTSSPPPQKKVRALAKKIISTKLETCTKDDTIERGGWASSQKLPALCGLARAWCINMHQLGVLHSLLPPKNSLDPPTHRLTRGAMGAGSP